MSLSITEADARVLLRNRGGSFDVIEGWMAEQPWQAAPSAAPAMWVVTG